jgi:photosystem II stability/assembly factor-like uncharacterized protein
MLDHSKGWALTDQFILFTSDGGQKWRDVTPSGSAYGKYASGYFMNDHSAWIVSTTEQISQNGVNVLRTNDGGLHWQSSSIPERWVSVLDSPRFLTEQEGFLELSLDISGVANHAVGIFHTTDGGQTWLQVSGTDNVYPNGLPLIGFKTGISFKDVQNGWATSDDVINHQWLYMTRDGGYSWSKQSLPDLPDFGSTNSNIRYTMTPPVFFDNQGFLPVQVQESYDDGKSVNNRFLILKSTDGGVTWLTDWKTNAATLAPSASDDLCIESIHNAWATDQDGNVYGTRDAGEHWSLLTSNVDAIKALSFTDAFWGWAVSDTKLWQTKDGGHHWSEMSYLITV